MKCFNKQVKQTISIAQQKMPFFGCFSRIKGIWGYSGHEVPLSGGHWAKMSETNPVPALISSASKANPANERRRGIGALS